MCIHFDLNIFYFHKRGNGIGRGKVLCMSFPIQHIYNKTRTQYVSGTHTHSPIPTFIPPLSEILIIFKTCSLSTLLYSALIMPLDAVTAYTFMKHYYNYHKST